MSVHIDSATFAVAEIRKTVKKEKPKEPVTIIVFGDLMLDRNVKKRIDAESIESLLLGVSKEIQSADIAVANLEGVFTSNASISMKDNTVLRFTFAPSLAKELAGAGFDLLSQANNHTADFGREGLLESQTIIESEGMFPFGDYWNDHPGPLIFEAKGRKIAFVGFNEFAFGNTEKVHDAIRAGKDAGAFTIVVAHWGEEYLAYPEERVRRYAYAFVDSGADLVIGAHPHVIQPVETYNGKVIAYSLGNFVFDQDFSKATREGVAIRITLADAPFYEFLPFDIIRSKPVWKNADDAEATFEFLGVGN